MQELFANNAESTIADVGGITSTATTITLASGEGARFPAAVTGTSQFRAALVDASTNAVLEYITVTNRSTDTLTVTRESEDATRFPKAARAQGVKVVDVITAAVLSLIGVPAGGTAGQVLGKSTSADYAQAWTTPNETGTPALNAAVAWTCDPIHASTTGTALPAARAYGWKVPIASTATLSNVILSVAATATTTGAYVGIYDSTGAQIAVSANVGTVFNTTGVKTIAMTTPVSVAGGPNAYVFVVLLPLGGSITLTSTVGGPAAININVTGLALRSWLSNSTSLSTLPSSFTAATISALTGGGSNMFAAIT